VIVVADTSVVINLCCFGQGSLLLQAKSAGFLAAVQPVLDDLQREAGFWIAEPLRQQVLQLAGEVH
jgi:predicted nucleic acid-binding protein